MVRISTEDNDKPVPVRRRDVPELLSHRAFVTGWREWSRYKRFGLPNGTGYRNERGIVIRAIEAFEQELEGHQAALMKDNHG